MAVANPDPYPYKLPAAVWVATATLHRDRGTDKTFTTKDIRNMIKEQKIGSTNNNSIDMNITTYCVANHHADAGYHHRKLYKIKETGQYRLYRGNDDHHPARKNGQVVPNIHELPPDYRDLCEWYRDEYCRTTTTTEKGEASPDSDSTPDGHALVPQGGSDIAVAGESTSQVLHDAGCDNGLIPSTPPAPAGRLAAPLRKSEDLNSRYDVFISYAHKDGADVASRLDAGLVHRGLRVWRDKTRLSISGLMYDEIKAGLDGSRYAIVVVTPAYYDGRNTLMELGRIVFGDYNDRIIVILHKTVLDDVLQNLPALANRLINDWDDDSESLINKIADKINGVDETESRTSPARPDDHADRNLLDKTSRGSTMGIPKTINRATLSRDRQVAAVKDLLESNKRVAITGDKGSGKSVLSCLLYEELAKHGMTLLVRCDDFLGIESAEELDKAIVPGRRLVGLAGRHSLDTEGGMTVIFDSLDAASRSEGTVRAFKRLIELVWGAGARTVVTVRSYDYKYSGALGATDWGVEYELGPLTDAEVDGILGGIGSPGIPASLKGLLANPLNLNLYALILEKSPDADLASIKHEIDLYDAHWHHYVDMEALGPRVKNVLYAAAEDMSRARKTMVPYGPDDHEAANAALSANILLRAGAGGLVRYFHHAYMDYAMSRALIERHQPIEDYLHADEYNVFLRPTLSLALAMAHNRDAGEFASIVKGVAGADIKHHWKIAAVAALADTAHDERCGACVGLAGMLSERPILQRHFLMALAKHRGASWFHVWGEAITGWAADPDNSNGEFIIGCLGTAASADSRHHGRVFAAAKALAEENRNGGVRKKAITMLADINAEGKAAWLGTMSGNTDPLVRMGVAANLPSLLEAEPDAVPDIFCTLYTHEEASGGETEHGSLGMLKTTGAPAQYNDMIRWKLGKMLPGLMDANMPVMLRAAILTAERMSRHTAPDAWGDPANGTLLDWPSHTDLSGREKPILHAAKQHVDACSDGAFSRLAPLLVSTRLVPFRRMWIDGMARRAPMLAGELAALLSDPQTYDPYGLRRSVSKALRQVLPLLSDPQAARVYEAIAASNAPRDNTGGELLRSERARAAFLSELPRSLLTREDAHMVDKHSQPALEGGPPIALGPFRAMPAEEEAEREPLLVVKKLMGADLDRGKKIALLDSMLKMLTGKGGARPDGGLLPEMEAFLLRSKGDPDPAQDEPTAPGTPMVTVQSVRGLVAECLIAILPHSKSKNVLDAIRELSNDPVNLVRSDMARSLPHMLPAHYDTARAIALSYSRDPDPRVQFFLPLVLYRILRQDPASASSMIENILAASGRMSETMALLLLALAVELKEPHAAGMLDRIVDEGAFDKDLRLPMPFILKERFIGTGHQDAALDLLYRMLHDPLREVRQKAAFFTLNGFDDNPDIDNREYIAKIAPHLARITDLVADTAFDLSVAETLADFFAKFWKEAPDAALSYLEKAVKDHGPAVASESPVAESSLKALAGLLQHHSLYNSEWNRCIDVLDAFAAVGWPAALELLSEMGSRD